VALTSLSHSAGCGCKLAAASIGAPLAGLPVVSDPNVLAGFGTSDDAGVYRLREARGETAPMPSSPPSSPLVFPRRDGGCCATPPDP
jgi:selenide,water dikinase